MWGLFSDLLSQDYPEFRFTQVSESSAEHRDLISVISLQKGNPCCQVCWGKINWASKPNRFSEIYWKKPNWSTQHGQSSHHYWHRKRKITPHLYSCGHNLCLCQLWEVFFSQAFGIQLITQTHKVPKDLEHSLRLSLDMLDDHRS